MKELEEKAIKAVEKFCKMQDFEVLEKFEDAVVMLDGDTLVFGKVQIRAYGDSLPTEQMDRGEWEALAARYLTEHPEQVDCRPVRFDNFSLLVIGPDKALLRHHIDALGNM